MENNEIGKLKTKIARAIRAMTVCCAVLMAIIVALAVFAAVCAGMNLKETDPNAVLIGAIVFGMAAILVVLCLFAAMIVAGLYTRSLGKLSKGGADGSKE